MKTKSVVKKKVVKFEKHFPLRIEKQETFDILEADAAKKKHSVNSLMNIILEKYVEKLK